MVPPAHPRPPRLDPVRILLEEPVVHDVLAHALRELRPAGGDRRPIRVLDVGSGTGEGLALLRGERGGPPVVTAECQSSYLGVDVDPGAVAAARSAHPEAAFQVLDLRDGPPEGQFDLYFSRAAPYSRLTPEELHEVLVALFGKVVRERHRAVFVVDVLGRYSVEWVPRWDEARWHYRAEEVPPGGRETGGQDELMTFFDRRSLGAVIEAASDAAGAAVVATFTDRSVLAGRHTGTKAFNPDVRPYRTLLNELASGNERIRPQELLFEPPETGAPDVVLDFFHDWAREWNELVREFGGGSTAQGERARRLADQLLGQERNQQRGLGAGHSLTATVVLDAT